MFFVISISEHVTRTAQGLDGEIMRDLLLRTAAGMCWRKSMPADTSGQGAGPGQYLDHGRRHVFHPDCVGATRWSW